MTTVRQVPCSWTWCLRSRDLPFLYGLAAWSRHWFYNSRVLGTDRQCNRGPRSPGCGIPPSARRTTQLPATCSQGHGSAKPNVFGPLSALYYTVSTA